MRSGEHELWDAFQATGPVRAHAAAMLPAMVRVGRALAVALRDFSQTMEQAQRGVLAFGRAYNRAMERQAAALQRARERP